MACTVPAGIIGAVLNEDWVMRQPFIPWPIYLAIVIIISLSGIGLIIARSILSKWYDPNTQDVEIRKELGRQRGMMGAAFKKLMRAPMQNPTAHKLPFDPRQ